MIAFALPGTAAAASGTGSQTATAQQPEPPPQTPQTDRWARLFQPIPGVTFSAAYSVEVLGNVSGGFRRGAIAEGLFQPAITLDLEKLARWRGATFHADLLLPHGPSLTSRYVRDLNTVSNIDAYDSVRLNEIWIEQKGFHDALSVRIGELTIDTEFFICESGRLFLNSCFGAPPLAGANFNAPVYPLSAPGVRAEWTLNPGVLMRAGIYSGDPGDPARSNRHGGRVSFHSRSGLLALAEAVYQTGAGDKNAEAPAARLPGTFKLGGFYHSGEFDDVSSNGKTHRGDAGIFAVIDQALYREPASAPPACGSGKSCAPSGNAGAGNEAQGLNFFTRGGCALPEDRNIVTAYAEAGLTYKGLLPGRDSDTCGIACSYTRISRDARGGAHHETVLEAAYQASLSEHLTFEPDVQYIFSPGGTGSLPDAMVIGARMTLSF